MCWHLRHPLRHALCTAFCMPLLTFPSKTALIWYSSCSRSSRSDPYKFGYPSCHCSVLRIDSFIYLAWSETVLGILRCLATYSGTQNCLLGVFCFQYGTVLPVSKPDFQDSSLMWFWKVWMKALTGLYSLWEMKRWRPKLIRWEFCIIQTFSEGSQINWNRPHSCTVLYP